MKKKNYIPMVITSIVAATLSACGSSKTTYQKSISWMTMSEIETMDPNTTVDTASAEQETNTFEGLFRLGKSGKVKPGIAKTAAAGTGQGRGNPGQRAGDYAALPLKPGLDDQTKCPWSGLHWLSE